MRPVLLLLLCPLAVSAQARLEPGARVRFDAPSLAGRVTGTVVAWESDTLFVNVDGDAPGLTLMLPADSVARIDVWRERRMTVEGAIFGLLGGTLLALVASPEWVDDNGDCTLACLAYEVSPDVDTRIAVLGGVGALVGVIIGSETRKVTWAPVRLERLKVGPAPDGGLAVGLRISF